MYHLSTSDESCVSRGSRRFEAQIEALFRTRTGDPLLTMEVLYQLS